MGDLWKLERAWKQAFSEPPESYRARPAFLFEFGEIHVVLLTFRTGKMYFFLKPLSFW